MSTKKAAAKKHGRPRKFDRTTVTGRIFEAVARGALVNDACRAEGTNRETLNAWCRQDPALSDAYARAREMQAHALAEQILAIAHGDDPLTQEREAAIEAAADELSQTTRNWRKVVNALENNLIQRDRLRVDSLKWYTSKIAPKLYGDRMDVTSGGKPVAISGIVVLPVTDE